MLPLCLRLGAGIVTLQSALLLHGIFSDLSVPRLSPPSSSPPGCPPSCCVRQVLPVEHSGDPLEPPEQPLFDLDAAVFLADFAFEAYRVSIG